MLTDELGTGTGRTASTGTAAATASVIQPQTTAPATAASQSQAALQLGETPVSVPTAAQPRAIQPPASASTAAQATGAASAAAQASVPQSQAALQLGETPVSVPTTAQTRAVQAPASSSTAPTTSANTQSVAAPAPGSSDGRGLTTASGAPLIIPNSQPAACAYRGPAAYNPYYFSATCPFQAGNVVGYDNWFQTIGIGGVGSSSNSFTYDVAPWFSANLEGGEEALRVVQQFVPDATLVSHEWPSQLPNQPPSYDVELPNGTVLDGGIVLSVYYNEGYGVTQGSDQILEEACGLTSTAETAA